jgi:hypothetical protein
MIILAHFCACLWIFIGNTDHLLDLKDRRTWLQFKENDFLEYELWQIYIFATYWIWEVFSTVGYGDYVGKTKEELMFSMGLEMIGLSFFSLLMGLISGFF